MRIEKLSACVLVISVAFLYGCDSPKNTPQAPSAQPTAIMYQVDESVLGKNVTFQSDAESQPAELTLTCDDGKIAGIMIKLDTEPTSPPPLRGVFGLFHFDHEPVQELELGYFEKGAWSMREGQEGVVASVARRFAGGKALYFTLNKPNGSSEEIVWQAPIKFVEHGCSLKP